MGRAEARVITADLLAQVEAERRRAAWWRHRALLWRRVAMRYRRWMHGWRRAGDELRDVAMRLRSAEQLVAMLRDALAAGDRNLLEVAAERDRQLGFARASIAAAVHQLSVGEASDFLDDGFLESRGLRARAADLARGDLRRVLADLRAAQLLIRGDK